MIEITIWGRGGQGAVTTGQILAIGAFLDEKECQTFPHFGVERAGAPVQAFVRIDDKKINIRSQVYDSDVIMVLEPSLLEAVNVTAGLKKGGILIVNSEKSGKELGISKDFKVYTVDATSAALKIFGKPIVNTCILGAFSAITKDVSLKSLEKAIDEKFLKLKGKEIAELNKKALDEVYSKLK